MSTVGIAKAGSRKECIKKSLDLVYNEARDAISRKNSDTLFIKLHVSDGRRLDLSTHPDALKAVVEYFGKDFEHIIAGDTNLPLLYDNIYGDAGEIRSMKFTDMRNYDSVPIQMLWADGSEKTGRISLLPSSVFTISLSLPQMHECLAFSGCTENMTGCIVKNKQAFHGVEWWSRFISKRAAKGNRLSNLNMMRVLRYARPDISVLDCFEHEKWQAGVCFASDDCVSVDNVASRMFGIQYIPHLSMAHTDGLGTAKLEMIKIAKDGFESWSDIKFSARPHYAYRSQIASSYCLPVDFRHPFYALQRIHRLRDMSIEKRLERDVV